MAKRTATSELNHDNWDKDDEVEEAGSFSKAADDVLKNRVIKVAKRRNPMTSKEGEGKSNIFGGFAFTKTTATNSNSDAFGFLSTLTTSKTGKEEPKANGSSATSIDSGVKMETTANNDYYARLKGLNESVLNWIKTHVDSNPFINLQPVFKDYEKYFEELEKEERPPPGEDKDAKKTTSSEGTLPRFNFGANNPPTFNFSSSVANIPNFGNTVATATNKSATISFCSSTSPTNITGSKAPISLSFGDNKMNSFGSTTSVTSTISNLSGTPSTTNTDSEPANEDGKDDEPPQVEYKPVLEDGHVYTVRCKVFDKKGDKYTVRGVGNLFLKPVPNSEKTQLIVRADTNIGNLICNFILQKTMPIKKIGSKEVMLVCLPTPETSPPPIPILFRVKNSEEADELLNKLEQYKK